MKIPRDLVKARADFHVRGWLEKIWSSHAGLAGLLLFFISLYCSSPCRAGDSQALQARIAALIGQGGYILSRDNRIVAAHNPDTLFSPASIWKITTAAAALHILGPEYRVPTDFYLDSRNNLYIKGHGDPVLVSEEIGNIAALFKKKGLKNINNIYLDDSAFQLKQSAEGAGESLNPYDAANSGLAVNFNTINLDKKSDGTTASAEPQTPCLPLMREKGEKLKTGRHRITIAYSEPESLRHTGELFAAIMGQHGINRLGEIIPKKTPLNLHLFHRHYSPPLAEIIRQMLLYSNNFTANQLFLLCGVREWGFPATWEKGERTLNGFLLKEIGLKKEDFQVKEGSGLSRRNKITPRAMLEVLAYFQKNRELLERKNKLLLIKSGTLSNVFSYAGYQGGENNLAAFVIILNQTTNNRDKILRLILREGYAPADNENH